MSTVHALVNFASTRPGFNFADYGDVAAYRADSRAATRDLRAVRELASVASYLVTDEEVIEAARNSRVTLESYSGEHGAGYRVSYCTGQYYPTEYRAAVARVLASAIWSARRREVGDRPDSASRIRRSFLFTFSRSVYRRFFA